jgi:peptidoglycan/LPS O-acetylase OafA/YrhL
MTTRFQALDLIRGVAAVVVLLYHMQVPFFDHGYLAVDLFFALSGFVICHSYEQRLQAGQLSLQGFARERLIRLYPMMALGVLMSTTLIPFRILHGGVAAVARQLLLIPDFSGVTGIELYPLLGVQWSLLSEALGNTVHVLALPWLSMRRLVVFSVISLLLLAMTDYLFGGLFAGWGPKNFLGGFVRLAFSYSAGMIIYRLYRSERIPRFTVPWWGPVLAAPLLIVAATINWKADLFVVLLFPPLIWCAIHNPPPARWARLADEAGATSYPLYATHYPLLRVANAVMADGKGMVVGPWLPVALGAIIASALIGKFVDTPLRKWLKSLGARPVVVEPA